MNYSSPLASIFSNTKDTESDGDNFKLEGVSVSSLDKKDSGSSSNFDGFMSADLPESNSPPLRLASMFSTSGLSFKSSLNKREKKAEAAKPRTMSYDVNNNKVECYCCGKQEYTILPVSDSSEGHKSHLCSRCSTALDKKQAYASTYNGTAKVSTKATNLVEYTCEIGHSWTVNIHRAYKSWCSTCRKMLREEKKKLFRKHSSSIRKENEKKQKMMFEEALQLSEAESNTESLPDSFDFEDLFESILPIAQALAEDYISQNLSGSCTYEQALSVYKILETDEARIKFILDRMSKDSKKQGYKKLAIALHPDKNRHPLSKEAFQKASELFK